MKITDKSDWLKSFTKWTFKIMNCPSKTSMPRVEFIRTIFEGQLMIFTPYLENI